MRVRYTLQAAKQIEKVLDDIAEQSPRGSVHVRERVRSLIAMLPQHPRTGRATSRPGVRRLVVTPYPYLIDYRRTADEIIVQRFRHASREPLS